MINTVYEILKPLGIPIEWQTRPKIGDCGHAVSFHFFGEGGLLYGDGEEEYEGGTCQIDIFSTTDYTQLAKQIKKLMKERGFVSSGTQPDTIEDLGAMKLYHKILLFDYIESEVM
ncbi:hypothetical protein [Clostridium sp. Marseille-QA1073]